MSVCRPTPILAVLLVLLTAPKMAHAYIDPGAGSYAFQILVATLVSALFAVKVFWGRIRDYVKRTFGHKEEPQDHGQSR